jgi:hypothetical protein
MSAPPASTLKSAPLPAISRQSNSQQRPAKIVPRGLRSFDEHDADFFLELLPGPRDWDQLPVSILFWKRKIERINRQADRRARADPLTRAASLRKRGASGVWHPAWRAEDKNSEKQNACVALFRQCFGLPSGARTGRGFVPPDHRPELLRRDLCIPSGQRRHHSSRLERNSGTRPVDARIKLDKKILTSNLAGSTIRG